MDRPVLNARDHDAVVFDMDGVVTDTASVHERAWKQLFDAFLQSQRGDGERPFSSEDYRRYVDGRSRYDGVARFLQSRGIELPWGAPEDPPGVDTVCALGNRKNDFFRAHVAEHGVDAYPTTLELLSALEAAGIRSGLISGSRNAPEVLDHAGVTERFAAIVDGSEAARLGIPGKPDPAVFVEAARRLGAVPARTVVVEDAIAGVEAGRRGGFALVIGVDRTGHPDGLREAGADAVVQDLGEVTVLRTRPINEVPPVDVALIDSRLNGFELAVFLDYDGTLTPIVERAEDATIDDRVRDVIRALSTRCTVAVVSGRDLDDVRGMVAVDGIYYAGSHGFDILAPDGTSTQHGKEFLPALDAAEAELGPLLEGVAGARLERKTFAIAVHFRQVAPGDVDRVEQAVRTTADRHPGLRITGGKMIYELRPDIPWDKGKALQSLLATLGLDRADVVPLYIGDDVTDEDGFRALGDRGIALVVHGEDDTRPTLADYTLEDPAAAVAFLRDLSDRLQGASTR